MTIEYELVRSKRKSIAIIINAEGKCRVRAPIYVPVGEIERFVNEKTRWIIKKQQENVEQIEQKQLVLEDGLELKILDDTYTLRLLPIKQIKVKNNEIFCPIQSSEKALERWLRRLALSVLQERVTYYAELMNVSYKSVKLSSAARRWGSCSVRGNLNFAWRLVFYPLDILDYVVVHELSHIGNMNHSTQFWQRVISVLPDYSIRQRYLKQHAHYLQWLR